MRVIIPMAGKGQRFLDAGYVLNKSLLNVRGKTVIDRVRDMFRHEDTKFIQIVSDELSSKFDKMVYQSNTDFITVKHRKLGPVMTILSALSELDTIIEVDEPIIVSYCDFEFDFDYQLFLDYIKNEDTDGCIVSYTGYHPHLVPEENVYAISTVKSDNTVVKVKEKEFVKDKLKAHHSAGIYYFRSYEMMIRYMHDMIRNDQNVNNEFYVSLVFNNMIKDGLNIKSYCTEDTFLQLGTPKDYKKVVNQFSNVNVNAFQLDSLTEVITMAGNGERFKNAGYEEDKPFIKVDGVPMYLNTQSSSSAKLFITKEEHRDRVEENVRNYRLGYGLNVVKSVCRSDSLLGQANTYLKGACDLSGPVLIRPCDISANYINADFLEARRYSDIIVFTTKNNNASLDNPSSFSWVKEGLKFNKVLYIDVKPKTTNCDRIVTGAFYVKDNLLLLSLIKHHLKYEEPVNGEYYLDAVINTAIKLQKRVYFVDVDNYRSFGTPEELKEDQYYRKYFNNGGV